jgi:glyoxylase-like metal-dependent hydrolase (beta-lactamase superfamily II)
MVLVVDPGTVPDQDIIVRRLRREKLTPDDVQMVFITHSHMDHYRHIGLFKKAKALDWWGLWDKDVWAKAGELVTPDIRVLKTPGHSDDGISLLVRTEAGIVAVCGDVFWKEDYPRRDPYATDREKLEESRELLQREADFIVPGHGGLFKTKRAKK